jgi:hypothetical protein
MDCNDFSTHWNALVAKTLDDATKESMGEHARSCRDCGKQWDAHHELSTTIQSVLEDHKLPPNLADDISRKVYQEHFGTALSAAVLSPNSALGISLKTPGVALFLAALMGGLVGYFLAGPRSQSALSQQIAYSQMLGSRPPQGGFSELMLYGMMSGNPVGGTGILGRGLPQITSTVQVVFFVFLLLWLTRTKLWNAFFPSGARGGIYVARWVALLAAILGLGRCVGGMYMTLHLLTAMDGGSQPNSRSLSQWSLSLSVLDQLWAIAFWLTLMIVLFTVANQLTLRFVGQAARPGTRGCNEVRDRRQ